MYLKLLVGAGAAGTRATDRGCDLYEMRPTGSYRRERMPAYSTDHHYNSYYLLFKYTQISLFNTNLKYHFSVYFLVNKQRNN